MKSVGRPLGYALAGILVVALFAVGYVIGTGYQPNPGGAAGTAIPAGAALVNPPHPVEDYPLTSESGEPISVSDLRGKAVLLFFGYTHCPDVCPTTLADFKRVKEALGARADQVEFVFVSVDGRRDTPEVVRAYLDQFDPAFIGMTGDEAQLQPIAREYGLVVEQENITTDANHSALHGNDGDLNADNYFVSHTSPSFLIDPTGYLRLVYFYGTEPAVIADGIRQMLG